MSIEELQNILNDYDNVYYGKSDKGFDRALLILLVGVLSGLDEKVDVLDEKIDDLDSKIDVLEARVDALEN